MKDSSREFFYYSFDIPYFFKFSTIIHTITNHSLNVYHYKILIIHFSQILAEYRSGFSTPCFLLVLITSRVRSTKEGNNLTYVCMSVYRGGFPNLWIGRVPHP